MTKDEALKLALEAMERLKLAFFKNAPDGIEQWESDWVVPSMNAITAIREALAEQPAQEDPCPGCRKGGVCRTPKCGRLKLPADHPFRSEQPAQQRIDYRAECWPESPHYKPAQQQEPVAGQPLPCPFCGHKGLDFDEGSTYRWGVASCSGCGASCGEIRREYPDQGQWHTEAIAEWNRRTSPPASKPWVGLTDEEAAATAYKGFDEYWTEDCNGSETEAWAAAGRAIEAKLKEKNA